MVLKAKKEDNGKRCNYCIGKGLNHTESECYTKKREKAKAKATKAQDLEGESESEGIIIKAVRIGKTTIEYQGCYEYDTASTHHSTNEYDRLTDVQHNLSINVTGHDGSKSICKVMGALVFRHNGGNIRHEECLMTHPTATSSVDYECQMNS